MERLITILREVRDPRDINARHDCGSMLFAALMATLCGAKSCVDIADFCSANEASLAEIVVFPHGAPSHDSFSRLFRLLDPDEMASAFMAFAKTKRSGLVRQRASWPLMANGFDAATSAAAPSCRR